MHYNLLLYKSFAPWKKKYMYYLISKHLVFQMQQMLINLFSEFFKKYANSLLLLPMRKKLLLIEK
jgi:hypothetical protein